MTIVEMLLIGFAVGLTGAMTPGPMLFATVESSMKTGWTAGPKMVLGHAVIEAFVSILIIFGFDALMNEGTVRVISLAGGIALCAFGVLILRGSKNASLDIKDDALIAAPFFTGIITSVSNPYFWLWWLTAGNAMILEGLKTGLVAAGSFVIGHWIADLVWYSLVSSSLSRGKSFISDGMYHNIITACGISQVIFGLWFIFRFLNIL